MSKRTSEPYDVAIVGAGMAGLYCAWRLLKYSKGRKKPSIVILEKSGRVGGRLKTSALQLDSHRIVIEEGGMRFLNSHKYLNRILEEIGLSDKKVKFGMGDDNNFYYIRGRRFARREAKEGGHRIWQELYALAEDEKGKSPFKIVEEAMRRIIQPHADPNEWKLESPFVWTRFRQMQYPARGGWPIYKWGFRALLEDLGLSNECIQMLMDTGGFTIPYEEMGGAGSGLQLIASFPEEPDFYTLIDGYEELPHRLHRKVTMLGAETRLNSAVRRLKRENDLLELETDSRYGERVHATDVILAIPTVPMSKILKDGLGVKNIRTTLGYLNKVVHMPLTKINLYFEDNWWTDTFIIKNGGCFTDLPLAQVYFFQLDKKTSGRKFTAITIYSDGRRGNYWRQLQQLGEDYVHPDKQHEFDVPGDVVCCKRIVVAHALRQLRLMFSPAVIPGPLFATISMWGGGNLGEGDHQWAVGADDQSIRSKLVKIDDGVFLCGEAISDNQDWVEGALRSGERLVQANFGLKPLLGSEAVT